MQSLLGGVLCAVLIREEYQILSVVNIEKNISLNLFSCVNQGLQFVSENFGN